MKCFEFAPNSEDTSIYFLARCPPNPLAKLLLLRRPELLHVTEAQVNINLVPVGNALMVVGEAALGGRTQCCAFKH